jgi:hypothetical protein
MIRTRLLALVAVLSLAVGVTACGDSDDGDSSASTGGGASADTSPGGSSDAAATPEGEVKAAYEQLLDNFKAGKAQAACALLTARGKEQTAQIAGPDYPTCEKVVKGLSERINPRFRPRVVNVRVNGKRAVATVKTGEEVRGNYIFANSGGSWKLDQALQ